MNTSCTKRGQRPWLLVTFAVLGALANLAFLWLLVFGLYGFSTPYPNPTTTHMFGVPIDMVLTFFFATVPGAAWLVFFCRQAGKPALGWVLLTVYVVLVCTFAKATDLSVDEARESIARQKQEWRESQGLE